MAQDRTSELLQKAEEVIAARKRLEEAQRAFEAAALQLPIAREGPPPPPAEDVPPPPDHAFLRALVEMGGQATVKEVSLRAYGSAERTFVKRTSSRLSFLAKKGVVEHVRDRQLWRLLEGSRSSDGQP